MRIGIDALAVEPNRHSGGKTYTLELIDALASHQTSNAVIVWVAAQSRHLFDLGLSNLKIISVPLDNRSRVHRVLCEQLVLPLMLDRCHVVDVFQFPLNTVSWLITRGVPSIVTIHDTSVFFYAHYYPAFIPRTRSVYLRKMLRISAHAANAVVTASQFSKAEICEHTNVDPGKVFVVHSGCPSLVQPDERTVASILKRCDLSRPYVFTVAATTKHKNLDRLVRAFSVARHGGRLDHHLVIAGIPGRGLDDLRDLISTRGLADIVHFLELVDNTVLSALYRGAEAFVLPSLYEGFGFPLLEAMQFGIPIASSNAASLPEVGGPACLYFDPYDEEDMAHSIELILTDGSLRRILLENARVRVKEFSWARAAREMMAVYHSCI